MPSLARSITRRRPVAAVAARHLAIAAASALAMIALLPGISDGQVEHAGGIPRPFSFLRSFTDQLGVPGFEGGTSVTAETDLYTGFAELSLRAGHGLRRFPSYGRRRQAGRFPILQSTVSEGRVRYTVTVFASATGEQQVNFVRVEALNRGQGTARAQVTAFARNSGDARVNDPDVYRTFRFARPAYPARPGLYFQPGLEFDPLSRFEFTGDALQRDGSVIYRFPAPRRGVRLASRLRVDTRPVTRTTVFGQTRYAIRLRPGKRIALDFQMPVVPVALGSPADAQIRATGFDEARRGVASDWARRLTPAMRINLPERKVVDTFYASLVEMLLARYRAAGQWVQTVNLLRYHAFYLRDAAVINHALDVGGLHREAGENLPFFLTWQDADGLFISRPGQLDGFGQALWAFGDHFARSEDPGLARRVYPAIQRAMAWFESARAADPLGLIPAGDPRDNEVIAGHLAGDNFWAYAGIEAAVDLARSLHENLDAERWASDLSAFQETLRARARAAAARAGGFVPPALDAGGGLDWGNYWAAYPAPAFAPTDGLVSSTIAHARRAFREGLATYGQAKLLHAYLGFRVLETELLRGEQRDVVTGLYDALAHTTSTNASFELGHKPFGARTVDTATVPHGWWAAEYVSLLRNMLVREQGTDLVLMSSLSPSWLTRGRTVAVADASTKFGSISFRLSGTRTGARLTWRGALRAGTKLTWPVPAAARAVRARGLRRGSITLPGHSGSLTVAWRLTDRKQPSFRSTAAALLRAYAHHGRN